MLVDTVGKWMKCTNGHQDIYHEQDRECPICFIYRKIIAEPCRSCVSANIRVPILGRVLRGDI